MSKYKHTNYEVSITKGQESKIDYWKNLKSAEFLHDFKVMMNIWNGLRCGCNVCMTIYEKRTDKSDHYDKIAYTANLLLGRGMGKSSRSEDRQIRPS